MDERTLNMIYSLIFAIFILAFIIFVIVKIIQANNEYNRNEKQSTIKRNPNQQNVDSFQHIQEKLPYYLKDSVFSYHESILYEILDEFCRKNNLVILSKIRIADFVQPMKQRNFYQWFNRISAKHVDFLICQPKTYKPLLAIELDDYTHNYKSRKERDEFINQVYSSVGLPILHIYEIRQKYVEKNISEILGLQTTDTEIQV